MAEAAAMVSNTFFAAAAVVAIAVAAVEMVLDGEIITVFRTRVFVYPRDRPNFNRLCHFSKRAVD